MSETLQKPDRRFYLCDGLSLAQKLLGKIIVSKSPEGDVSGIITETEAYMGTLDKAAHACSGRPTPRTEILYGSGGFAYVYMIYGVYFCLNVSANGENIPECALIRSLEPIDGLELMKKRRGTDDPHRLCRGPGCLSKALGLSKVSNGLDLCGETLYILNRPDLPEDLISASKRRNIDYSGEAKDFLWRFTIKGSRFLSA
ncbi:MAG: DNA-3-methyladenine glycosylase [Oscillospiraceae bacterium]|jgi:DNA-3-methyladenine glycosylase|nr:DNA-3-methyladenine glycosylase [Oscillospiraceae bacterium]